MKFLLNGYFGFGNAGDEAVLAAMLAHLRVLRSDATFVATSGDPAQTAKMHGIEAVGRQSPRELMSAMQSCDVFLSGGGSLVQDVTSLRNAIYYTTLIRVAKTIGKPVMIYAQGVGPLNKPMSQRVARKAFQRADVVTVRDEDSAALLRKIGVTRSVEITADPVWDLAGDITRKSSNSKLWIVALRSWPGADEGAMPRLVAAIRDQAHKKNAKIQFLPMQPGPDDEILQGLAAPEEILLTKGKHPREIIAMMAGADLVLAMRLHALIFAASLGLPTVAFDYDPKVSSLAKLLGAPLVQNPTSQELQLLPVKIEAAAPPSAVLLEELKAKARRNAQLAARLK